MKAKLFKTLATGTLALVLGVAGLTSCTNPGPEARLASISELTAWDTETRAPVCFGEFVQIKDVVITAQYGEWEYSVQNWPATNTESLTPIEVHFTPTEDWAFDVKDVVTITGTVDSYLGHAILKDATAVWGTAGQEACDGAGPLYYYQNFNRGQWDYNVNRQWSGVYIETTLQFASIPTLEVGVESQIQFVFPGEDLDLTNEDNYFSIDVIVPALTETQFAVVNEWLSNYQIGDGVYLFFQVYFHGYLGGILPYTSFRLNGTNQPKFLEGVYEEWGTINTADTAAFHVGDTFTTVWPSLESEAAYSYVVTEGYEDDETGLPVVITTIYTYDTEAVILDIAEAVEAVTVNEDTHAAGWALVEINEENAAYVFAYLTWEEVEGEEGWVMNEYFVAFDNETSVEIDHYGTEDTVDGGLAAWANPATPIAYLEFHALSHFGIYGFTAATSTSWTTGIVAPTLNAGLTLYAAAVDYSMARVLGRDSGIYLYDLFWAVVASNSTGNAENGTVSAWIQTLAGNGFVLAKTDVLDEFLQTPQGDIDVLFNPTTGVVVSPYADVTENHTEAPSYVGAYVFVLSPSVIAERVTVAA
jgi:hypothetical protein